MANPLIGTKLLVENPQARSLHEEGLRAELDGGYGLAHEYYDDALDVLERDPPSVDVTVQRARITRDHGFTFVRQALSDEALGLLDDAKEALGLSVAMTGPLLETGNFNSLRVLRGPAADTSEVRREIAAEDGATTSLLGRMATAAWVLHDNPQEKRQQFVNGRVWYNAAYQRLLAGSNGYYRASNATNSARHEYLGGGADRVNLWLGRAASATAWTAAHDLRNFPNALRTTIGRRLFLRSSEVAVQSVYAKP